MKLFITGISGLLGLNLALQTKDRFTVSGAYNSHPVSLTGVKADKLDLCSPDQVRRAISEIRPDAIVHTAALTDVDGCEFDEAQAHQLNVEAARSVALAAQDTGARLTHISTDQLFDGESPWMTESDEPEPINSYAKTKYLAEQAVQNACPGAVIIRTNFYGWGTPVRTSFSDWILKGLQDGRELTMFSDVFFTPILINHLGDTIVRLLESGASGVFHVCGRERISKHAFAVRLAEVFGHSTEGIRPISIDDLSLGAKRPKEMSLNSAKAESHLGLRMPSVDEGVEELKNLRSKGWNDVLRGVFSVGAVSRFP